MEKQTDAFERPAHYWLLRAQHARRQGDARRAAVMERHARRTAPQDDAAAYRYALALRQLDCLEASTREAFSALAAKPDRWELLGLIGQNLADLRRERDALYALTLYVDRAQPDPMVDWDEEIRVLYTGLHAPGRRCRARLRGLTRRVAQHVARGERIQAGRLMWRALELCQDRPSAQLMGVAAKYLLFMREPVEAYHYMCLALEAAPGNAGLQAAAAQLFWAMGRAGEAQRALARAVFLAWTPQEERQVMEASDALGRPDMGRVLLEAVLRRKPYRYPTVYNMGVCLLKLGRWPEASRCIHLLRELDPDDAQGKALFERMQGLAGQEAQTVASRAKGWHYYGAAPQETAARCLSALDGAPEALAARLEPDGALWRELMTAVRLEAVPVGLLTALSRLLPAPDGQRLLRETLTAGPDDSALKREALAELCASGVRPPYLMWRGGCVELYDPSAPPPPTFLQRMTVRLAHRVTRLNGGTDILPYLLDELHALPPRLRLRAVGERRGVWAAALSLRYRTRRGLAPSLVDAAGWSPQEKRSFRRVLSILRKGDRHDGNDQL